MNDDMVPELDDLWLEANEHVNHGKFHEAIEIYKYILVRYSDNNLANENANAHLGDVLLTIGQTDLAEGHIRNAFSYNPENPEYLSMLGFVYYDRYEWENAVRQYKLALDKESWNREYLRSVGEVTFNAGDKRSWFEYLPAASPFYTNSSGMLAELATADMSIGDMTLAREYAEEAVRTNPTDIMAHAVLGELSKR